MLIIHRQCQCPRFYSRTSLSWLATPASFYRYGRFLRPVRDPQFPYFHRRLAHHRPRHHAPRFCQVRPDSGQFQPLSPPHLAVFQSQRFPCLVASQVVRSHSQSFHRAGRFIQAPPGSTLSSQLAHLHLSQWWPSLDDPRRYPDRNRT